VGRCPRPNREGIEGDDGAGDSCQPQHECQRHASRGDQLRSLIGSRVEFSETRASDGSEYFFRIIDLLLSVPIIAALQIPW
jgi:hypothetical protein